jgi:hypothetical protein
MSRDIQRPRLRRTMLQEQIRSSHLISSSIRLAHSRCNARSRLTRPRHRKKAAWRRVSREASRTRRPR